jgi:sulfur carrier protein
MTVTVNGQSWDLPDGTTLADVLHRLGAPPRGVAVALNGAVVPRACWAGTPLPAGASVDVVTAVQGG